MLSDAEILRRLRAIRFSPRAERLARRAVSMRGIALDTGLSREFLHRVAAGQKRLGKASRTALSASFLNV